MIASRMNVDEEVDPFYSHFDPNYIVKPTMDFQVERIFKNFGVLCCLDIPLSFVHIPFILGKSHQTQIL